MRNLKKILALVLALVMSLSLMATASAADFTDKADIEATGYQTAVDVLAELGVVRGYENGSFQPNGDITRAEVAAIIYRIATKDVKDAQAGIYTTWGKFADVKDTAWYAGYVNYCANAEIVKGKTATTFDPEARITGYQVLAMILRTMGYGKNGEFEGDNWAINTAAQAKKIRIIDNILEQKLGDNATRAMVAEILFNALLTSTVEYNALNGYVLTGNTLGKTQFGLEKLEGVVMANEYASLTVGSTLAAGKTALKTAKETYTLNIGSTLDDIGEYRYTYVIPGASYTSDLVCTGLYGKEANTRYETTDYVDISSASKFAAASGMVRSGTQEFINFDLSTAKDRTTKIRIQYWMDDGDGIMEAAPGDDTIVKISLNGTVSPADYANLHSIFANDDKMDGWVVVGTKDLEEPNDISNDMTWDEFCDKYLNESDDVVAIDKNDNGNWLKVIDNNGDGYADYAFKVVYSMAQIARVSSSGAATLDVTNMGLNETGWTKIGHKDDVLNNVTSRQSVHCNYDDPAAGDVVYYAVIDGKVQAYEAEVVPAVKIDKVNRNTLTAYVGDAEYVQSEVHEHIVDGDYSEGVRNLVVGKVAYDLFRDRGGYLAAFVRSELGGNLVLLTDGWFMAKRGGDEYAAKVYNRETKELDDTDIVSGGKLFIGSQGDNNQWRQLKSFGGVNTELNDESKTGEAVRTIVAALDEDGNLLPVDSDSIYTRTTKRMIAVDKNKIVKDKYLNGVVYTTTGSTVAYNVKGDPCEIRALTDTVYYYVYPAGGSNVVVREYVGYDNLPNLTDDELAKVEDVYAVGTRQTRVSGYHDYYYYTADVVVVEFSEWEAAAEAVFVYDFPVVAQTKAVLDDIQIIDSNGEVQTVTVDIAESYGYTKVKENHGFVPGLYWMYMTATEGVYKIRPLGHDEINKTRFVVGEVATTRGTAAKAYTEIGLCAWDTDADTVKWLGLENPGSSQEHVTRYLTDASKYYTLAYGPTSDIRDWASDLEESDWGTTLAEVVDYDLARSVDNPDLYDYNFDGYVWNNNKVLMLTKSNGDIIWAVSLANMAWDYDNDEETYDLARYVWARCLPEYVAPKVIKVAVDAVADTDSFTVKWNGGEDTATSTHAVELPAPTTAQGIRFTVEHTDGATPIGGFRPNIPDYVLEIVDKDVANGGLKWTCVFYEKNTETLSLDLNAAGPVAGTITVMTQDTVDAILAALADEATAEQALAIMKGIVGNDEVDAAVAEAEEAAADEAALKQLAADVIAAYEEYYETINDETASVAAKKEATDKLLGAYGKMKAQEDAVKDAVDAETGANLDTVIGVVEEGEGTPIASAKSAADDKIDAIVEAASGETTDDIIAAKELVDDLTSAELAYAKSVTLTGGEGEADVDVKDVIAAINTAYTDEIAAIADEANAFVKACAAWKAENGLITDKGYDAALAAYEGLSDELVALLDPTLEEGVEAPTYTSDALSEAYTLYQVIKATEASKPVPAKAALKIAEPEEGEEPVEYKWDSKTNTLTIPYTGTLTDEDKLDKVGVAAYFEADNTAKGELSWAVGKTADTFTATFTGDGESVTGTDSITVTVVYKNDDVKELEAKEGFEDRINDQVITVAEGATVAQLKGILKDGSWVIVNPTDHTTTGVTDTMAAKNVLVMLTTEYGTETFYTVEEGDVNPNAPGEEEPEPTPDPEPTPEPGD